MSQKVDKALKRLNEILPLKENQEKCSPQIKTLYQQILKSFVSNGRVLSKDEMRKYVSDVEGAIKILDENELVIISENREIIGAYPFTTENREFKVQVNGLAVNAMCAIDALAISLMYDVNTQITSRCRMTDIPIYLEQSGTRISNFDDSSDIHVCIAWHAAQTKVKCANSLCMEMFFVNSRKTAEAWQENKFKQREVFTFDEAMELSRRFFVPLLTI